MDVSNQATHQLAQTGVCLRTHGVDNAVGECGIILMAGHFDDIFAFSLLDIMKFQSMVVRSAKSKCFKKEEVK